MSMAEGGYESACGGETKKEGRAVDAKSNG